MKYNLNDCTPTQQQMWLLQTAVLPAHEAAQAWELWRARVNLDEIDPASYRLLPLAYRNLARLQVKDPLLERLKGVYRHNWYKNQTLFRQVQQPLTQLEAADIPLMLLKGAAMTLHHYQDNGIRFMHDFDIMIPPDKFTEAANLLLQNEWHPLFYSGQTMAAYHQAQVTHASGFTKNGFQLDLHRALLPFTRPLSAAQWQNAATQSWQGINIHFLDVTTQFFHTCVHGVRWSYGYLTWIPDALLLLPENHKTIDWTALVHLATQTRTIVHLKNALAFLSDAFQAPIPAQTLQALAAAPVSWTEAQEYEALSHSIEKPLQLAKRHFFQACRYRSLVAGSTQPIPLSLTSWLNYFYVKWQLDSWWQFLGKFAAKLRKNIRRQNGWA